MISRILNRLFEKKVVVNCAREPYLHRWYLLRTEPVGILHKFVRSDEDRALHDHPWSFIVIPLWGGYVEHTDVPFDSTRIDHWSQHLNVPEEFLYLDLHSYLPEMLPDRLDKKRRVWPLISTRYRGTDYRHRVELINDRPSWSLFIRFRKVREWGFWEKAGFVQWNKWWQEKCE